MSRRLGERPEYERSPIALARAVHDDYHEWTGILRTQAALAYSIEDLSGEGHEEPLPAGPETAPYVTPAKTRWGSHDFPRPHIIREIERNLGWRVVAIAKVESLVEKLAGYENHGETLAVLVRCVCFKGEVRLQRNRGWRHGGPYYKAALEMFGDDSQMWRALTDAWSLLAVIAVDATILTAAQEAGATDERAVAWARERGLLGDA